MLFGQMRDRLIERRRNVIRVLEEIPHTESREQADKNLSCAIKKIEDHFRYLRDDLDDLERGVYENRCRGGACELTPAPAYSQWC